jgi:hypothetical protein
VWAVIVMRNIYFDLPYFQDLERLSKFILRESASFVPTYQPGISPAMQVKYSPLLPMDKRVPFFSVRDSALESGIWVATPEFSFESDSTENLLAVQTKDEATRLFKKKKISLIVYETKKVFMSGRGEEMAHVYAEFCSLIGRYYRESTGDEKLGALQPIAGARKKSAKKHSATKSAAPPLSKVTAEPIPSQQSSTPASTPSTPADTVKNDMTSLATLMQNMRLASINRSEAKRSRDLQ